MEDKVLKFIDDFLNLNKNNTLVKDNSEAPEILRYQFHNGYCYYFAKILQIAFPGGSVYLTYPICHFVYEYNNKFYDIEGIYEFEKHDCEKFIHEDRLGDYIKDFLRNGDDHEHITQEEFDKLRFI